MGSNTAGNTRATGKPFVKGDARINRKGRPKSFDALRALAQAMSNEMATSDGKPVLLPDGSAATQTQMILLGMMRNNPERFLEIAFGKVPQPVDVTSGGEKITVILKWPENADS